MTDGSMHYRPHGSEPCKGGTCHILVDLIPPPLESESGCVEPILNQITMSIHL